MITSLVQLQFKLFSKLDIEDEVSQTKQKCYAAGMTEGEIFMLDVAFLLRSTLADAEEKVHYYWNC